MKWLAACVLPLALIGCSARMDTAALEAETVKTYNLEAQARGLRVRATEAALVHDAGNTYKGTLKLNDGSTINADVTYDGDKIALRAGQ